MKDRRVTVGGVVVLGAPLVTIAAFIWLTLFLIPSFVSVAQGSTQLPMGLEGPVSGIVDNLDGTASITVMGIDVEIPVGTPVNSPSAGLTIPQLADPAPLPGRALPGFIGATAIITGTITPSGTAVAGDVFVEPAENVMLADVTGVSPLKIHGVEIVLLTDPRMPGKAVNPAGIEIDLNTVIVGTAATVEGYFGIDGKLYAFLIEAEGQSTGNPNQTAITRAECREGRGELRVQGFSTTDPETITIRRNDNNVVVGTVPTEAGGLFELRVQDLTLLPTCPAKVTAENSNGSDAVAEVDIR